MCVSKKLLFTNQQETERREMITGSFLPTVFNVFDYFTAEGRKDHKKVVKSVTVKVKHPHGSDRV